MQNASVDVADLLATNGVLHVLSQVWLGRSVCREPPMQPRSGDIPTSPHTLCQVLLPPRQDVLSGQGLLQQLDSVPAFRLFRELLQVRARQRGARSGSLHHVRRLSAGSQGQD